MFPLSQEQELPGKETRGGGMEVVGPGVVVAVPTLQGIQVRVMEKMEGMVKCVPYQVLLLLLLGIIIGEEVGEEEIRIVVVEVMVVLEGGQPIVALRVF